MKEKLSLLVIGLLAISLILNIVSFKRVDSLSTELSQMRSTIQTYHTNMAHQIGSVFSRLDQAAQEEEMVVQQSFRVGEDSTLESVQLLLDYTLREVASESAIKVLYKEETEADWLEAQLISRGANSYTAQLNLDGRKKYQYILQVGERVENPRWLDQRLFASGPVYPEIISHGTRGKNTELEIMLVQSQPSLLPIQLPSQIVLKVFEGNRLKETVTIDPASYQDQGGACAWQHALSFQPASSTRITLEVIYADGSSNQGEIWPGRDYYDNLKGN